ncbi:hypothetical protein [Mycobacterium sp.]|uniref:hypothetical protein n=1 Tax=Mycobacterium sp. TaxID=1785 RepID=UPI003D6A3846
MTTAASDQTTAPPAATHPRSHPVEFWRARLGALASRGEVDGPRVAEARAALSWYRTRSFMVKEMSLSPERAEALLDQIDAEAAEAQVETAQAVAQ